MATWEDVRRLALALPETAEVTSREGHLCWQVRGKSLAWERPLRNSDRAALGASAWDGEILSAYVPDLGAKEAILADAPEVYFTTAHFDGYPMVLVRLERIPEVELRELLVESWLQRAPKRLARSYLDGAG